MNFAYFAILRTQTTTPTHNTVRIPYSDQKYDLSTSTTELFLEIASFFNKKRNFRNLRLLGRFVLWKSLVTSAVVCCVKYVIFEFFKRREAHGSPLLFSGGQNKSPASSSLEKSIRSFIIPHFYIHHGGTRGWCLSPPQHTKKENFPSHPQKFLKNGKQLSPPPQ